MAIRIGHLEDSSLVARRLSDVPMVLVGAPILLAEYGTPTTPEDLVDVPFIHYASERVVQRLNSNVAMRSQCKYSQKQSYQQTMIK